MNRRSIGATGVLVTLAVAGVWVTSPAGAQSPQPSRPLRVDATAAAVTSEWSARYDGSAPGNDDATAVVVTPDGSTVIVTGDSQHTGTGFDYETVAYDAATGARKWVARYDGHAHGDDVPLAAVVTPDGATVIVTGSSAGTKPNHTNYATVAYDTATGAWKWGSRYHGPGAGDATAHGIAVTPDGSMVIVTGTSPNKSRHADAVTVAYSAATGAEKWFARYDGPAEGDDVANAVTVTPNGALAIVTGGSSDTPGDRDFVTVAYAIANGLPKWVARYDGPIGGDDVADAIAVSPDSSTVFVTGYSTSATTFHDYATVAYKVATGEQQWVGRYDGPGHKEDDPHAVAVTPDGATVVVTGESGGTSGPADYATVAYDAATGASRWVARYEGAGHRAGYGRAAAVTPDGATVIVTGYSQDRTGSPRWSTVGYDTATGAQEWAARYDTTVHDGAQADALAVAPDSSAVFVTGETASPTGTGSLYRTIAYGL